MKEQAESLTKTETELLQIKLQVIFGISLLVGIVMVFCGIYLLTNLIPKEICSLVSHVGVAFLTAALVGTLFEPLLLKNAMSLVQKRLEDQTEKMERGTDKLVMVSTEQREIMKKAVEKIEIARIAEEAGIKGLYLKRKKALEIVKKKLKVEELIQRAIDLKEGCAQINLLGICLADFFKSGGTIFKEMNDFCTTLANEPDKARQIRIRVLALYPYTIAGINRMKAEEYPGNSYVRISAQQSSTLWDAMQQLPSTSFYNDCRASMRTLYFLKRNLEKQQLGETLQVRFSATNPMVHLWRFNDEIFIEPYHLGKGKRNSPERCMGGLVPVIQIIKIKVSAFEDYLSHFEYLWELSEGIGIEEVIFEDSTHGNVIEFLPPEQLPEDLKQKIGEFVPPKRS